MGFSCDFYIKRDSWLHRLDPRVKLIISVAFIMIALSFKELLNVALLLIGIHVLLISAQIPKSRFVWVWKMMIPVTIMIIALWPFFYQEGKSIFAYGFINITVGGIIQGLAMALRICALGFSFFILMFTTDQAKIIRGLVKLGVPYKIGLMFAIALRYLPTFFGIITMVSDAQKARGLDLDGGSIITKLKSYMPILVAVLITALKTSDNLSNALETRAFSAAVKNRTYYNDIKMKGKDFFIVALTVAGTAATLII